MIKVKVAIKEVAAVNYTFEDGYPEKTCTIRKLGKKILPEVTLTKVSNVYNGVEECRPIYGQRRGYR